MAETLSMEELEKRVTNDPGGEFFPELASRLVEDVSSRTRAREICFQGLKRSPANARGRLVLARAFFLDGMFEFSVRELVELRNYTEVPAIQKLLDAFGIYAQRYGATTAPRQAAAGSPPDAKKSPSAEGNVVAEVDLDADFLDALDEVKQS